MSTNLDANLMIRLLVVGCLSVLSLGVFSKENIPSPSIPWDKVPLRINGFQFGSTTRIDVYQRLLGQTTVIEGDGGRGTRLCYRQKAKDGELYAVMFTFFGAGESATLSTIEWRKSNDLPKPIFDSSCNEATLDAVPLSLFPAVGIGSDRAEIRRLLGAPSAIAKSSDSYSKLSLTESSNSYTKIEFFYDGIGKAVGIFLRQIETR